MSAEPQPKTKFAGRLLGLLVFMFAVSGVIVLSTSHFLTMASLSLFMGAPPEKKFMSAWQADIKHLDQGHFLPPGFHQLKTVKLFSPSEKIKKIFYKYPLELTTSPQGQFTLEIFADQIEDGGVIIQYDLINNTTGNTIWELGRTFPQNLEAVKEAPTVLHNKLSASVSPSPKATATP